MANLTAAVELADRVYIYDNSIDHIEARLCARTQDGHARKIYCDLPEWISDTLKEFPRHDAFVDERRDP